MPLNLDGAIATEIKNVNSYLVTGFMVDVAAGLITVNYDQLSDGAKVKDGMLSITGQDFIAVIGYSPVGETLYEAIKNKLYEQMMSQLGTAGIIV